MSEQFEVNESESVAPRKSTKLKSGLLLLGFAGVVGVSAGVFAANININSNSSIELGTGATVISSCITSADVEVTTTFVSGVSPSFEVESVNVSNVANTCSDNEVVRVDLMDSSGDSLLSGALPSSAITANPDSFTADFSSENISSDDVSYVLLESSAN